MERKAVIQDVLGRVDGAVPGLAQPIAKHRKMASSPFVFLRGAAGLFYADIASGVLPLPNALTSLPLVRVMGDCHVSNFGFLTEEGSHGDSVIFAPNDFDDACVGHAVWDLARYCVSLALTQKHCLAVSVGALAGPEKHQGKAVVSEEQVVLGMRAFLDVYQQTCARFEVEELDHKAVIASFSDSHILYKRQQKALRRAVGGDEFYTKSALARAIDQCETRPVFDSKHPELHRLNDTDKAALLDAFAPYVDDGILDAVKRVNAGTGSVNMARYYLLVGPADYRGAVDLPLCHIVEVKQQRAAAPLVEFSSLSPINRLNAAHLTVSCQKRMQHKADLLLDEVHWRGVPWLVRSRHHAKVGIGPENIALGKKASVKGGFIQYAQVCGQALALAHCRSDRRSTRFEAAVGKALPQAKEALIKACLEYATLVEKDVQELQTLLEQGAD